VTEPLPPLRERLRREAGRLGVPIDVVELDYGLSYLLAAIFANRALRESLVFKGGTALRKAYFGEYRSSADLDFTAIAGPRGDALEQTMREVAAEAARLLGHYGPFMVSCSRRPERSTHPAGQEAFLMQIQFPWQRSRARNIKVEITVDEPLILSAESRPLLHNYGESLTVTLLSYRLEEIVAEKLRTFLQARKRVGEGRWVRNCARDYYDLWHLFRLPAGAVDRAAVVSILPEKCAVRRVAFTEAADFFPPLIVSEAQRQWQSSLADLVRPLPEFERVIADLRESLQLLMASEHSHET
jgi:uncharacterized protein